MKPNRLPLLTKLNRLPLLTRLNRLPLLTRLNRLPLLTRLNRLPLLKKVGLGLVRTAFLSLQLVQRFYRFGSYSFFTATARTVFLPLESNRSPLLKKVGYRPTDYWSPVADRAAARAVTRARRMWRALMIGSAAASSASSAGRKA